MSKEAMKLALEMVRNKMYAHAEMYLTEALKQEQDEPVALKVYRGELCYKSQADDQSFGMWCPVTKDFPFPEGTKLYTTPQPKLEQEQGEPVADRFELYHHIVLKLAEAGCKLSEQQKMVLCNLKAVTKPQPSQKQEQGEPDYWLGYGLQAHTEKPFEDATPVYTKPQPSQKPWVGLTDEDIEEAYKQAEKKEPYMGAVTRKGIAEAFEQILKEKNT